METWSDYPKKYMMDEYHKQLKIAQNKFLNTLCKNNKVFDFIENKTKEGCDQFRRNGSAFCQKCSDEHNKKS